MKNAYVIICTLYIDVPRFSRMMNIAKIVMIIQLQHQFQDHLQDQNLHLKLKMKKSVYKSYRVINY